jgi:hypothetical protein
MKFCRENPQGHNYIRFFEVEQAKAIDESLKMILKHKKTGGIVSNMLDIFDVIQEAHCRQGHLKVEKTLVKCTPAFYSPTYELCRLFINNCFVCHEKHPNVPARKGAKKPILSSKFRDCFQVDLINMKTMRKQDVYGQMQRWIMTMKDHLTSLVYLYALPWKKAVFVAAELEKFFGFVRYSEIFHTGVYTIMLTQLVDVLVLADYIIFFIACLFNSDNGKEFITAIVVDLLKASSPNCFIVTGCPRTPHDQGSIESANKIVQQVLRASHWRIVCSPLR